MSPSSDKKSTDSQSKKHVSFEKNLGELEAIIKQMESGELSLDEMVDAFEKGKALAESCSKSLDSIKQRIEKVTAKGTEEFQP